MGWKVQIQVRDVVGLSLNLINAGFLFGYEVCVTSCLRYCRTSDDGKTIAVR